jgi:hypothetical protein
VIEAMIRSAASGAPSMAAFAQGNSLKSSSAGRRKAGRSFVSP